MIYRSLFLFNFSLHFFTTLPTEIETVCNVVYAKILVTFGRLWFLFLAKLGDRGPKPERPSHNGG